MARKQASGRSAQTQLRVGRLVKAHGLKGALKLELYTDDPERRFVPGAEFALQVPTSSPWHGKRLTLAELRWYNGQPVGFFEGVTDRTGAESLVKAILWVDQSPDEPQEEDAWYDHQLIGLAVVRDGERIGTISRVDHLPAQDLLVVGTGDREVMVPFVKAIVPTVDTERGLVTVTPPAGLFEDLPDDDEPARLVEPAGETDAGEILAEGIGADATVAEQAVARETGAAETVAEKTGAPESRTVTQAPAPAAGRESDAGPASEPSPAPVAPGPPGADASATEEDVESAAESGSTSASRD